MIINLMLGRKRGGLEQAALDYAEALSLAGFEHHSIFAANSWAAEQAAAHHLPHHTLPHRGGWDVLAAWRLHRFAAGRARAVICHGNRALSLALLSRLPKVIAVAHNYKTRRFARADACFAITEHARAALASRLPAARVFLVPNMVRETGAAAHGTMGHPPVIGSMGRFVEKKAFPLLIEAWAMLRDRGVAFRGIIGGGGDEAEALQAAIAQHCLQDCVTLAGWVGNKAAFFAGLDLFVLPSHHEPFGIVLIEAMEAGLPVISTASEGPREIIRHHETGLLTPLGDAGALADAMQQWIAQPPHAARLAASGQQAVRTHYNPRAMAERLRHAIDAILTGN